MGVFFLSQMLHIWNIHLHLGNCQEKCRHIFQHHGSHLGLLPLLCCFIEGISHWHTITSDNYGRFLPILPLFVSLAASIFIYIYMYTYYTYIYIYIHIYLHINIYIYKLDISWKCLDIIPSDTAWDPQRGSRGFQERWDERVEQRGLLQPVQVTGHMVSWRDHGP